MRITIETEDCKEPPTTDQPPSPNEHSQTTAVNIGPAPAAPDAAPAVPSTDQAYGTAPSPDHPAGSAPSP